MTPDPIAVLAPRTLTELDHARLAKYADGVPSSAIQGVLEGLQRRGAPTCVLAGTGFAGMAEALRYDGVLIDGLGAAVRAAAR